MNPTPTLLDLLADETQHAIVRDAESRRLTREAHIVVRPTPLRQAMGRALISLGERIGGIDLQGGRDRPLPRGPRGSSRRLGPRTPLTVRLPTRCTPHQGPTSCAACQSPPC